MARDAKKQKRTRGRPVKYPMPPEKADASPEEIAEIVLQMPPKAKSDWRYLKETGRS